MKVLFIANTAWYLRNFRSRLAERLEAEGHEVVLAAPADDDADMAFFHQRRYIPIKLNRRGTNPFAELLTLGRVKRLLRAEKPDVVLTWTPKPNLYAAMAGRFLGVGFALVASCWVAVYRSLKQMVGIDQMVTECGT